MSLFESKVKAIAYTDSTGNKVYPVVVDIKTGIKSNSNVVFTTGDINTAFISVQLMDGAELYNTRNKTIICKIQKPSGEIIERTGTVVSQGIVEFMLGVGGVNEQGVYLLDVLVQWGTGTITTPIFTYTITQSIDGDVIQEDDRYPILESLIITVNSKLEEISTHADRLTFAESKNNEQDLRLKQIEYNNKVQDVYISGLFNENKDGRLTIDGEGNSLKLEGSKEGLVEVDKVVGGTLVNLAKPLEVGSRFRTPYKLDLTKTYTFILEFDSNMECYCFVEETNTWSSITPQVKVVEGHNKIIVNNILNNTTYTGENDLVIGVRVNGVSNSNVKFTNLTRILLEGDYTNKPIPQGYFQGMQSSFENQLVTQEMVDSGEELEENLGKYRVDVKVRGKNLFNIVEEPFKNSGNINLKSYNNNSIVASLDENDSWAYVRISLTNLKPNTDYIFSYNVSANRTARVYSGTNAIDSGINGDNTKRIFNTGNNTNLNIRFFIVTDNGETGEVAFSNIQLEEGTQATPYEPYKEYTRTVYLNSPLLKDDTIEEVNGKVNHVRKGEMKILNGTEKWNMTSPSSSYPNICVFMMNDTVSRTGNYICDKFPITTSNPSNAGVISTDKEGIFIKGTEIKIAISTSKLSTQDVIGFAQWLQQNPVTVVYKLAEPWYEKISDDKLLLEIPNNATLTVESVIPCQSVKATYTGNVPSLYKMDEDIVTTQEDLSITQVAVDFLLMSNIGEVMMESFNKNTRGGNNMDAYFASRIIKKALQYEDVITRYPEYKEGIDFILKSEGYGHLIK